VPSPDDQFIAITQPQVEIIELASGMKVVIYEALPAFYPSWRPNGKYIAFTSVEDGHDDLFLFVLDRGAMKIAENNYSIKEWRMCTVKAIHQKQLIVCGWVLVLAALAACASTAPVVETVEIATAVEDTQEVEVIVTVTATATPEPPTPTPIPTITPTPLPTVEFSTETVSFTTDDEINLEGTLFLSEGATAVVFAHMAGGDNDQQNWIPFAERIARRGFTSLTFNFRCYGNSECGGRDSGSILISRDMGAAINFLHTQGFERVVCVGASMGGRGCVNAAFEQELVGLVIVSGTGSSDPERKNLDNFVSPNMPKLFIVSEDDHIADRTLSMTRLYESAPEPKTFKIFPGIAHGTELFDSKYKQEFRNTLLDFLEEVRS
jgi:dienelactone hydrolase